MNRILLLVIALVFGLFPLISQAQSTTLPVDTTLSQTSLINSAPTTPPTDQQVYQPTPTVISPAANSTVSMFIPVTIYIPATSVQRIEVYANTIFIGLAQPQSSIQWVLNWDSKKVANGNYQIWAKATILATALEGQTITTVSPKIPIKVFNQSTTVTTPTNTTTPITNDTTTSNPNTATDSSTDTSNTTSSNTNTDNISSNPSLDSTTDIGTSNESSSASQNEKTAPKTSFTYIPQDYKVLESVTFPPKGDSYLEKIEYRKGLSKELLVFSGKVSQANALVQIEVFSEPIVMTTRSKSDGSFEYIFEKPLEPGNHRVEVTLIDTKGKSEKVGSYSFLIARAQASAENPNGESLKLVDPNQQMYYEYFKIAGAVILLAILVIIGVLILKGRKKSSKGKVAKAVHE